MSANITVFNITGAPSNGVFRVGIVSPPPTGWINFPPSETQRANAGIVALDSSGQIDVQVNMGGGSVDFVVDINGYYTPIGIVNFLNGLSGSITLAPGTDLSLVPSGQTLTLSANSDTNNTANTLVRRDLSGNFSAGTITGNLIGAASANVLKAGDTMTGSLTINPGNITLVTEPSTTTSGSILKNGSPFLHDFGVGNVFAGINAGNFTLSGSGHTAIGVNALRNTAAGTNDTAAGFQALLHNTDGNANTAVGAGALFANTTGSANTATGMLALTVNSTGGTNTAVGQMALQNNNGDFNTAVGASALQNNTTTASSTAVGAFALQNNIATLANTAVGYGALRSNTTAINNTAVGFRALYTTSTGIANTAVGDRALTNTTASDNTGIGLIALGNDTSGYGNTAVGAFAGNSLNTGAVNIAVGYFAGTNLTTGDNNIDLGNAGVFGDANTIRIGAQGTQTATFIAGISNAMVSGMAVSVDGTTGQLGVPPSSVRFKKDIQDVGDASLGLMRLRPVTFRYKAEVDPAGLKQYGLVAEEVAEVYPDLVTCDVEGQPQTVRYQFLVPMLLNEVQKDRKEIEDLQTRLERLEALLSVSAR